MDPRGAAGDRDFRILILTPQGRDASLAEQTLARSGFHTRVCSDLEQLRQELAAGAGAALIAEEALPQADNYDAWFGSEQPWSSLPLVTLLGRPGSSRNLSAMRWLERRPNVNFLERPVPKRTLISTIGVAVEARRLQYAIRDALEAQQVANRKKDEFLAMLAHELRNPLAPIHNAVFVLQKLNSDDPEAKDKARSVIAMVERQVDHLIQLVDDLLDVSRITTGKIELKKRHVDLADCIHRALETSEPLIKSQQHQLSVRLSDKPLVVDGDPVRLVQVFAKLLNNAAKYTPPGGRIEISSMREGEQALICVRDNGIGIPEEMLPRVFELFSQSRRAMSQNQRGIGIGLALVRSLVELHGGHVEASSGGSDRGSEFIVRLPLLAGEGEQAKTPSAVAATPFLHRVLVAEDEKDVADSFAMLLQSLGAEVLVAYSGAEALSIIGRFKPRLAFVDIGMPVMDGYETARRLRSTPEGLDLVLVALSGWGGEPHIKRAKEAGFNYYFVKPISLSILEKVLALEPVGSLAPP